MNLYKALNNKTKNWWYFKKLREQGEYEEARKLERQSIRNTIKNLRHTRDNGGFLKVHNIGSTLYINDNTRVESYYPTEWLKLCHIVKIPILDITSIKDEFVPKAGTLPLIGVKKVDKPPWSTLSIAPWKVVAAAYIGFGAQYYYFEPNFDDTDKIIGLTDREKDMISAFFNLDSNKLFKLMSNQK